ncbi:MAG: hypothetical protein ACKO7G_01875 [Gammaproteobacteria bacterium]
MKSIELGLKSNQVKRTPEMSYQVGFNWDVAVPGLGGSIITTGSFSHQDEYYNGLKNAAVDGRSPRAARTAATRSTTTRR